jgi:hypothetical protein
VEAHKDMLHWSKTMRKRWFLVLGTVVVASGVLVWMLWPTSRLGPDNFKRIQVGMSLTEVEEILGQPGDKSTSGGDSEILRKAYFLQYQGGYEGMSYGQWIDDLYMVFITFDLSQKVVDSSHGKNTSHPTVRDWLRSHLGI